MTTNRPTYWHWMPDPVARTFGSADDCILAAMADCARQAELTPEGESDAAPRRLVTRVRPPAAGVLAERDSFDVYSDGDRRHGISLHVNAPARLVNDVMQAAATLECEVYRYDYDVEGRETFVRFDEPSYDPARNEYAGPG